jgi:hypothetical protein
MHKLGHTGFCIYSALAVDMLHEFELGVWKAVLAHLIRILYAYNKDNVEEMNKR